MKLNIPICRAKQIDSDECVVGYLIPHGDSEKGYYTIKVFTNIVNIETYNENNPKASYMKQEVYENEYKIDISTLEISFDNGKNWDKTEWCKNMLNIARNAMENFREV